MSSAEHRLLRQTLQNFVAKEIEPGALERDQKEHFDLNLFRKLADLGLLGITAPEIYGGSEMDAVAAVITHEELAYSDPGLCLAYLAHAMLCVNNLAVNASESQKKTYLPKLCSGEWVGCMAMSEPDVGTDILGMKTSAKRIDNHYVINGRKMWITNGVLDASGKPADITYLYAKTGEQISTFIVTPDCEGFSVGQKIMGKTGMRASSTAELVFENAKVPVENLVGEEGDSIKHMMRNLEIERVTLAAIGLGIGKRCLDIMIGYANERKAFGKPIAAFGQIQQHIANSYAEYQAASAYVYQTAQSDMSRLNSDGVKLIAAPMAKKVADSAMQVLGGNGYVSEYVAERLWRDAKLLEIGGGTLEAHQKNISADLLKRGGFESCGDRF
ncbi:MAG: acyl-CoA dehydrogenase family protein [Deltaproteobacteria bacterium]|nr:acyl-CoA dehydrogenase family protein [Deltaproteobacteria bacterium]